MTSMTMLDFSHVFPELVKYSCLLLVPRFIYSIKIPAKLLELPSNSVQTQKNLGYSRYQNVVIDVT